MGGAVETSAGAPVYIVGAAESPLGKVSDHSELSMATLAAREALSEAGLTFRDVDGLFTNYMPAYGEQAGTLQVADYLGLHPRYADSSDLGGAAFEAFINHAIAAIRTKRCEVALICYASRQRSRRSRPRALEVDSYSLGGQFEAPYAPFWPVSQYALAAARHMYEYGTRAEDLAQVAVAARQWAQLNPKAWIREPLSVAEVLDSPLISDPLRKLDCCLVTDGGGALVVTAAARARNARKRPIRVLAATEAVGSWYASQMRDMTTTTAATSARAAYEIAGLAPSDIDFFQPYDNFTSSVILQLEDCGFCRKGEGGAFVSEGRTRPGGELPTSTSGGGLSYCHPGALGLLLLVEAVRQLRHEAGDRQVADAAIGLVNGVGGPIYSASSTVILARD